MDPHRRAERRSIAYHQAIAARISREPTLLELARARLRAWQRTAQIHPRYAAVWARVLALPVEEMAIELAADVEEMRAARQSSPFAGALSARERWDIWRSVDP